MSRRNLAISGVVVTRLMNIAEDPIGIKDQAGNVKHAREKCIEAATGVDPERREALMEAIETRLRAARTIGNPTGRMTLDVLTARIFAHHGIDPMGALWLSLLTGLTDIDDETTGRIAAQMDTTTPADNNDNLTMIVLAPNMIWHQSGRLSIYDIPDTIAHATVGRPLSCIVKHPILAEFPITIAAIEDTSNGRGHMLVTDHVPTPVDRETLTAASKTTYDFHACDGAVTTV